MRHNPHNYRTRIPAGLIVGACALVSLPIIGAGAWLWLQWSALELLYPAVADALRVVLLGTLASAPAVALWAAWRRWADHRYIQAGHIERLTIAQRSQGLPASITSLNYHDSHRVDAMPPLALPEHALVEPLSVPTFGQLLDQGLIGPGRPLILGYNAATGQAITGGWKDLYSCGVGAQQGAGKTWLLAFLLAQSTAAGGRLIICDLHAGDDESLANRIAGLTPALMCDIANTPKAIVTTLEFANDKLERRKSNAARWPIVVCCDEWTSLLRTPAGAALPQYIQNIAEQGRKFNVNGLLAA